MLNINDPKRALSELISLFKKWNINDEDWMLILHYAEILQGYSIKKSLRKGHLNIFIDNSAIPWKQKKKFEAVETIIPANTKYFDDFIIFQKRTGFEFDLIPISKNRYEQWLRKGIEYIFENKKINILSIPGNLDYIEEVLSGYDNLSESKISKILLHLEEINLSALNKNHTIYERSLKLMDNLKKIDFKSSDKKTSRNQLRGQVVFKKGSIFGGNCWLFREDYFYKDKEVPNDSILVCHKLSKKTLPYIQKVAGIIAEEGGILSHAAIISREFEKPCVIGVRNATNILKDRNLVEVDADKGIVKIIT